MLGIRVLAITCGVLAAVSANASDSELHPAKSIDYWGPMQALPLEKKIAAPTPRELIDYLHKDNLAQGWPNVPVAAKLDAKFEADVRAAVRELPETVKALVNPKLLGIFFVTDLGGTGYTEFAVDKQRRPIAGYVVLDRDVLVRKANEWASWKESSPFKPAKELKIEATIEDKKSNDRKNAIQYILLHELGHIVNIGSPLLPIWGEKTNEMSTNNEMDYFKLSWQAGQQGVSSREDTTWPLRAKIVYYQEEKKRLPAEEAIAAYRKLKSTGFPTLYAVTNPQDDFAEAFASYIHVVLLKKPWSVKLKWKKESFEYQSCWQEARCKSRRDVLEKLLKTHS